MHTAWRIRNGHLLSMRNYRRERGRERERERERLAVTPVDKSRAWYVSWEQLVFEQVVGFFSVRYVIPPISFKSTSLPSLRVMKHWE